MSLDQAFLEAHELAFSYFVILYRDRREFERVQGPASDSGSTLMRISREARERNYW